jgi:thiamine biosynthesis lipoprotein
MIQLQDNPKLHCFSVEAMYTTFSLRLDCADKARAQEAASACINQLEILEGELSRFRHDSDVSRINQLQAGESLYISERTHACLLKAFHAQAMTAGLFDVTLGALTWPEGSGPDSEPFSPEGQLEVAPDQPRVACLTPGAQIDLGGIGKGFALDQLALTLASYQIKSALLCAGASTLLAIGPETWPIELTGDGVTEKISLQGCALSASGTGIQGAHVIHPDFLDEEPPYIFKRIWVTAPEATFADAFSTACLLMADDEIEMFADEHADLAIYAEEFDPPEILRIDSGT